MTEKERKEEKKLTPVTRRKFEWAVEECVRRIIDIFREAGFGPWTAPEYEDMVNNIREVVEKRLKDAFRIIENDADAK